MTVGGWVSAIIVGIIIGYLGRWIAPGKKRGDARIGFLLTMLIGVVAAVAGTAIAASLDWTTWLAVFAVQVVLAALVVTGFRRLAVSR